MEMEMKHLEQPQGLREQNRYLFSLKKTIRFI